MAAGDPDSGLGLTLAGSVQTSWAPKVLDVNIGGESATSIDTSDTGVTSGWRTFIAGMKDAGEMTVTTLFDKVNQPSIGATNETWTLTLPTTGSIAATVAVSGFIQSASHAFPMDDVMASDITIKLSGVPSYTDES